MTDTRPLNDFPQVVRALLATVRDRAALGILTWTSLAVATGFASVGAFHVGGDDRLALHCLSGTVLALLVTWWCRHARRWVDRHDRWAAVVTAASERKWKTSLLWTAFFVLIGGDNIFALLTRPDATVA